jgi:type I restriction enzyme S subunit
MSKYKSKYKGYPTYKGSGVEWIGEVPEHWEVKPAYAVAIVRNGYPFKSELFKREGVESDRLIRIRDIAGDDESIFTKEVCPDSATISNGDVLIGMDGDFNVHRWRRGPAKLNQRMCAASGRTEAITQFLSRCLPTPLRVINDLAYATTVKHLSSYEILHTRIAVPPTHELTNINVVLDRETTRIDALITKKTRFIELLKEKRSALITHAVTKGLDPNVKMKDSGVEWIGEVPEGWEVKRLRHIASFKNSNVDKKSYEGQGAVNLCNYTDVYYNEFITSDMSFMPATASSSEIAQFALKKGDVIITKDSEDPSDIGIPAVVAEDLPGVVCGYHLTMIRVADFDTARVLHRSLQSHPTQAHFFVEAPGITRYGLGQDAIGDLHVCVPPEPERGNLADQIDRETARIDALVAKVQRSIDLLKERRSALITAAVTGQVDLRESESMYKEARA